MPNNMNEMRGLYNTLSAGEKRYLANKLYKEDRIVAQKVEDYIPEDLLQPELPPLTFDVGDYAQVAYANDEVNHLNEDDIVKVVEIDPADGHLPYRVSTGDKGCQWARRDQLEAVAV